jgi:hypothetical protein
LENTAVTNERAAVVAGAGGSRWGRFWFSSAEPAQLHLLRLLAGLLFLAWMLSFAGHQEALLSLGGWFDRQAYVEASRQEPAPPVPIGWSIFYLAGTNRALFDTLYWGAIVITLLFTLGMATRITGVLTWVCVVSFLANPATSYDADFLLGILAFYLMVGYLLVGFWNGRLTPLEYVLGPHDAFVLSGWFGPPAATGGATGRRHSYAANVILRLVQVHFAIIVVTSGLHKLQMADWWAGVALWYPLHPPFETTLDMLNRERTVAPFALGVLSFVQYLALAWQIAFPAFAWRRGWWRFVLIGGAIAGWIGTALVLGLPWFGPFYLVCCLSYLHADEWQRVLGWRSALGGRQTAARPASHKVAV